MTVLRDGAKGLSFLHSKGFYHRDFHLMNLLIFLGDTSNQLVAKISDFGSSLLEKDSPITFCGHMRLSAPEVLTYRLKKEPIVYSYQADVFMFGMVYFFFPLFIF